VAVVTGWRQNIDDLAGAVADLLTDTSVRTIPLTDAAGTLACRDAVVIQLRQLAGAVADMPPVAQARPLQMFDVTNRPAQALQQALAELPRARHFGAANVNTYFEKGLPRYEQRWRDAARATVGLEIFVEALSRVPDRHCWSVLRDLADLAAAIPALDHDLSEAVLPLLKGEADLAVPYAMLTHPAHDAVRVCSTEIRSRVPAVPPSTAPPPSIPAALGTGELDKAMNRYVRTVLDRASKLSIGDLRAVTRLLQVGGTHAAVVLERAQQAVPGADVAAAALRQLAPLAEQLRDSPAKTLGPEQPGRVARQRRAAGPAGRRGRTGTRTARWGQPHGCAALGRPGAGVRQARPKPGPGTGDRRPRVPRQRPDARAERGGQEQQVETAVGPGEPGER